MVAVVLMSGRSGEPTDVFVRDVTVAAGVPWYFGVMSTFGVVVWGATAAWACSRALTGGRSARPMAVLALLAALLCADDALLIHERGRFPVPGTDQLVYFSVYAALGLVLLVLLVRARFLGAVALLSGAGLALAASVALDLFQPDEFLVEDTMKLVGALLLLCIPVQDQLRAQAHDRAGTATDGPEPHVVDLREPVGRADAGAAGDPPERERTRAAASTVDG